jgi:hypothetical protein
MSDKVQRFVYALSSMQAIPEEDRDDRFLEIMVLIEKYIDEHCVHSNVTDLIDIDPDTSRSITYCEICYKTVL